MKKRLFSIILILILIFNFISAEMLISNVSVQYEERILDQFDNLQINEKFVDLIIYLRDISDADALISGFSQDEIGRVINRNISNRITVKMTKEAFLKLIQDNRVESVYYNAPIQLTDDSKKNNFFILGLVVIMTLSIFIGLKIYKRLKKRN